MMNYVVIGSGAAGIAAVEGIRRIDPSGKIHLISDEPEGYYSRPGLAYFLTGELVERQLYPFTEADFQRLDVERVGERVLRLHPESHKIELQNGEAIPYNRLLVATGARAATLNLPGSDALGVVKLDNILDARIIIKIARKARRAIVVGGGITALEIVEGLVARKVKVHYFLRGDRYWSNVLDETESRVVENRLQEEGVKIHYHTELAEILTKRGRVAAVRTRDGHEIKSDMVAVAVGIRPHKELAADCGIQTDRGIIVNERLQTSEPDIYAAGDVAQVYDPVSGSYVLDSLWGLARNQGTVAGLNMAGENHTYRKPVPFNVTRLANLTTTIIGTVGKGVDKDLVGIARGDSETWRQLPEAIAAQSDFDVNRLRVLVGQHTLVGAVVMGDQTLSRPLQHLVARKVDITAYREGLLQPGAPIGDLVADMWTSCQKS